MPAVADVKAHLRRTGRGLAPVRQHQRAVPLPTKAGPRPDPTPGLRRFRLWRAAGDDNVNTAGTTSFATRREWAEAYTDNPGFGGPHLYVADVQVDPDELLDLTDDEPEWLRDLRYDRGLDLDYAVTADSGVERELRERGVRWVRFPDSFPDGAVTMAYLAGDGDDPELRRVGTTRTAPLRLGLRVLLPLALAEQVALFASAVAGQRAVPVQAHTRAGPAGPVAVAAHLRELLRRAHEPAPAPPAAPPAPLTRPRGLYMIGAEPVDWRTGPPFKRLRQARHIAARLAYVYGPDYRHHDALVGWRDRPFAAAHDGQWTADQLDALDDFEDFLSAYYAGRYGREAARDDGFTLPPRGPRRTPSPSPQ